MIDKLAKCEKDLVYDAAILELTGSIAEALKKKPSSKLISMSKAIQDIIFYVTDLRIERYTYDEYMRRRLINEIKLEKKVKELEQELYSYEDNTIERRADFEADAAIEDAR
jgi:hypothetical protein